MSNRDAPGGARISTRSILRASNGNQIKTRTRVRDLAEVYTHERELNAMLDLIPDVFPSSEDPANHDRTFLEPACGCGNFLEAILRRKLCTVTTTRYGCGERYEHRVLRCLASIYGIDIDQENVLEARDRLRATIVSHFFEDLNTQLSPELATAVDAILNTNIVRADTLADAHKLELVAYHPGIGGTFTREWSCLEEPEGQLDLFGISRGEPERDAVPVHYRDLAAHPKPTVVSGR
ncbi:type III restriction endonuclease subunit M [Mycobacterium sp. Dal123C01]|uniref:type III restriction endonuclease subunit M n=1 Tax=Mycobacterium sp. Dal123C01 TaxID=3457577 RepID=UPI00403EDF6B